MPPKKSAPAPRSNIIVGGSLANAGPPGAPPASAAGGGGGRAKKSKRGAAAAPSAAAAAPLNDDLACLRAGLAVAPGTFGAAAPPGGGTQGRNGDLQSRAAPGFPRLSADAHSAASSSSSSSSCRSYGTSVFEHPLVGRGMSRRSATLLGLSPAFSPVTTATYDGRYLELNGEVLGHGREDERRKLVTHILVLPGVRVVSCVAGFMYCTSLSSITLPEGLTSIGGSAFSGCTSLSSITLPEGLTSIGTHAFSSCTSLNSLTLPNKGLTCVGYRAFDGCRLLERRSWAAGYCSVEAYLRFISSRANRRYAVIASLARLRSELYARQAKRARHQADDDAVEEEEEEEEEVLEDQAGVLSGALAFDVIHSDDLWRHILEFV